eukprot:gene37665-8845_t
MAEVAGPAPSVARRSPPTAMADLLGKGESRRGEWGRPLREMRDDVLGQ